MYFCRSGVIAKPLHLLLRTVQTVDMTSGCRPNIKQVISAIGQSFYRSTIKVREQEESVSADELDVRNQRWDEFSEYIEGLSPEQRLQQQVLSNERASRRLEVEIEDLKQESISNRGLIRTVLPDQVWGVHLLPLFPVISTSDRETVSR